MEKKIRIYCISLHICCKYKGLILFGVVVEYHNLSVFWVSKDLHLALCGPILLSDSS